MVPSGAMRTHGERLTGPPAACAAGRMCVPSVPSAKQNVMPPRPANRLRRVISGDLSAVGLSAMVMAQPSCDARWTAAMMRL